MNEAGIVQFKTEDPHAVARCAKQRRCQFCGNRLGEHVVFMGGETAVAVNLFRQAPFHRACAVYALQTCPYLSRTKDPQFVVTARSYRFGPARFPLENNAVRNAFQPKSIVSVVPAAQVLA